MNGPASSLRRGSTASYSGRYKSLCRGILRCTQKFVRRLGSFENAADNLKLFAAEFYAVVETYIVSTAQRLSGTDLQDLWD